MFIVIHLVLGAREFAEQDTVTDPQANRPKLASSTAGAVANRKVSPCIGFSFAVFGIIVPLSVFSWDGRFELR